MFGAFWKQIVLQTEEKTEADLTLTYKEKGLSRREKGEDLTTRLSRVHPRDTGIYCTSEKLHLTSPTMSFPMSLNNKEPTGPRISPFRFTVVQHLAGRELQ